MIDGSTRWMGLIGEGISHSLSPLIHNKALGAFGINGVYLPFEVPSSALEGFLEAAFATKAIGFNVTVPLKEKVSGLCPESTCPSVNTLYRQEGVDHWLGASTDGEGFVAGLAQLGTSLDAFSQVVFLGNGGAVQGLCYYFDQLGFQGSVTIFRRSGAKDSRFAKYRFPIQMLRFDPREFGQHLASCEGTTLLIQASAAPLRGDKLVEFAREFANAPFQGAVVDLCYGHVSELRAACLVRQVPFQDGIPMLIEQARASQKLWWGRALSFQELAGEIKGAVVGSED